jgi:hypothetical protein
MTKLALTLTAAAFVLGLTASSASAQTQQLGAASMQTQLNNATPIVTPAACRGFDRYCPCGDDPQVLAPSFPSLRLRTLLISSSQNSFQGGSL